MASENETVMAVCSEWRDCIESADPTVWNDERIAGLVKTTKAQQLEYLARIEAAWKRERESVTKCNGFGNAAAMREALFLFVHDFASFRKDVEHGILHMMQCMDFVKKFIPLMESAISAPARNCDRQECARINGAAKVWYKEEIEPRVKGLTMGHKEMQLPDWLLAPMAQLKGEGDGM